MQINPITIRVDKEDIKTSNIRPKEDSISYFITYGFELNIVGFYKYQAKDEIEKYIEKLSSKGEKYGKIIHGFGVFKNTTIDILKKHSLVETFSSENLGADRLGATLITIKY